MIRDIPVQVQLQKLKKGIVWPLIAKMATQELAAMLDELMGRNRNIHPNEKVKEITWEDSQVCRYYIVQFCPHDLFTNTKADLGSCPKIHDEDLRKKYQEAADGYKKTQFEDEFLRFSQRMVNDLSHKIKRAKERLLLTQMENAAANGISPQMQEEIEEKINILTDKINVLVDQAETAGCQGDVEEAQGLLKLCDQLKSERDELKTSIGLKAKPGEDGQFGPQKAMEVCETCGAFLIVGDAQQRIDDHLMGKQHVGYARLKASVDTILEERRKKRDIKEADREKEVEERKKKRDEDDVVKAKEREEREKKRKDDEEKKVKKERSRSKSRTKRDRSREKTSSRRKSRSRSRDRQVRRRSGSRDRHRQDRERQDRDRRDRDRQPRRSRSRDRRDRERKSSRKSRSRSRDRRERDRKSSRRSRSRDNKSRRDSRDEAQRGSRPPKEQEIKSKEKEKEKGETGEKEEGTSQE